MRKSEAVDKIAYHLIENGFANVRYYKDVLSAIKQAYEVGFNEGKMQNKQCKPVIQYDLSWKEIEVHESASSAARKVSLTQSLICKAAKRKSGISGGFKWRFV